MSSETRPFSLGREGSSDGSFRRQDSRFRGRVTAAPDAEFPLVAGRYHLYIARACPWAHRTLIGRRLMGLESAIPVSFVGPLRDERGWAFDAAHPDDVNGWSFLSRGL